MRARLTFAAMPRIVFLLLTALWVSLLPNWTTLSMFATAPDASSGLARWAFVLAGWVLVFTVNFALLGVLGLVFWGRAVKVLCALVLVVAALLSYYTVFLGTLFERTMFANILQTHWSESRELIGWRMVVWVTLVGVLPALVLWRLPLRAARSWWGSAWHTGVALVVSVLLLAAAVAPQYKTFASAGRNRTISFYTVAPANLVAAGLSYWAAGHMNAMTRAPRGEDAQVEYKLKQPRLVVFVLGETARAQNQSLNGYGRDTNARMKTEDIVYFKDTQSCGTATAISVPCIFSGLAREKFSLQAGRSVESLVDVVSHAGVQVIWRDNDGGCKGVCDRALYTDFTPSQNPKWCPAQGECYDEILLDGLEQQLREIKEDTFLVLHIKGSHGPAYYRRYPPAFERFKPACQSNELTSCSRDELVNAYDNSLVYTDHVLGETVALLKRLSKQFASVMFYASDHGESLGEKGLYLHGMPYALAPLEQTRVPMLAWLSPQFIQKERWAMACVRRQNQQQRSHDNVYHTLLGLLEIRTKEYQPTLDIFVECDNESYTRPRQ